MQVLRLLNGFVGESEPAQLQLEFKCWLINSVTGDKVPVSYIS